MKLNSLLELAKETALEAGSFLKINKKKKKKVLSQDGRDIKLELDRKTEKLILKKLKSSEIKILGEEYGYDDTSSDAVWVVDPLDGTANYYRGLDQACVSIGLMLKNEPLLGVVFNFNTNELFFSSKGNGSFLNDERIHVSTISNKNQASLTTGFPSTETINATYNFLDSLQEWKKIRMFGSAALSCAYVASGRCDVYMERGIYLWDFAAGASLVKEAGGQISFKKINSNRYEVKFSNAIL